MIGDETVEDIRNILVESYPEYDRGMSNEELTNIVCICHALIQQMAYGTVPWNSRALLELLEEEK